MQRSLSLAALIVSSAALLPAGAQDGAWSTGLPTVAARGFGAAGAISGKVFFVGGGNYSCGVTPELQSYTPGSNTWTTLPNMPTARYEFGAAELNGQLYAVGGNPGCGSPGNAIRAVEAYDPVGNTWSSKTPLPTGLWDAGVASVNGLLYVIGGFSTAVYVYDPGANSWSTKSPLPVAFSQGATAVANGIIYVIGGNQGNQATVQAYNPLTDSWSTKANLPTPRSNCTAATLNGFIYVAGGYTSTGVVATVEAYNPSTDTWSTVAPLPLRLWAASAAVVNGTLYIMGGLDAGNSTLSSVEAFTPSTLIGNISTYPGLSLVGLVGTTNRIDFKTDLSATNWNVLTNLILPSSPYLFIDPTPATTGKRFYRVVEQ